jgi:8-oxo-dGTP diphosphatase
LSPVIESGSKPTAAVHGAVDDRIMAMPNDTPSSTAEWHGRNSAGTLVSEGNPFSMTEVQFYVGVHGVIANRGRIILLKRAERMSYKPGSWDLPGGHLALGESFEECLIREVKEETGLDVAVERLLGLHKAVSEPYLQAFYACHTLVYQKVKLMPNEHVESQWVTLEEMSALELIPYLESALRRGLLDYVGK